MSRFPTRRARVCRSSLPSRRLSPANQVRNRSAESSSHNRTRKSKSRVRSRARENPDRRGPAHPDPAARDRVHKTGRVANRAGLHPLIAAVPRNSPAARSQARPVPPAPSAKGQGDPRERAQARKARVDRVVLKTAVGWVVGPRPATRVVAVRARSAVAALTRPPRLTPSRAQDDTKPSPPAQEPEDLGGDNVAPAGQPQSDLNSCAELHEALQDPARRQGPRGKNEYDAASRSINSCTKYSKVKSAPAGPGREIKVKPGEQTPVPPAADLPGLDLKTRFSSKNMTQTRNHAAG